MNKSVLELTQEMIAIPSVTAMSNVPIADYLQAILQEMQCEIEREEYIDPNGEVKVNLIGKIGQGTGGIALCSHNDTVPGQEVDWDPFTPQIVGENLLGRGSCDMKGPLAATLVAAASVDQRALKKPIYIVLTADEEIGLVGAKKMAESSPMLAKAGIEYGIIAEPTRMIPVYSHKGGGGVTVTAMGKAAHSSTGLGVSANLLIAPFLADMAELDKQLQTDESFMNREYDPPHQTMNLTIDDGNCALNVTCPKTVVRISVRSMPNSRGEELTEMIAEKARSYGFEAESSYEEALYSSPTSALVKECETLTGKSAETVPYGTDGLYLQKHMQQLVILGPGDIAVAHTVGEFVPIQELHAAVDIYSKLITTFCM